MFCYKVILSRSFADNVPQATVVMKHHLTVIIFFIPKGAFLFVQNLTRENTVLHKLIDSEHPFAVQREEEFLQHGLISVWNTQKRAVQYYTAGLKMLLHRMEFFSGILSSHVSPDQSGLSCLSVPSIACNMEPAGVRSSAGNSALWWKHCTPLHCTWVNQLAVKCHLQKLLMLDMTSRESFFPEGR